MQVGIRNTSDTLYEVLASLIPERCKFLFHGEGKTKLEQAFCQFYWFGVSLLNNNQIYLNQLNYTCLHFHKKHFETTFYYKAILATFLALAMAQFSSTPRDLIYAPCSKIHSATGAKCPLLRSFTVQHPEVGVRNALHLPYLESLPSCI